MQCSNCNDDALNQPKPLSSFSCLSPPPHARPRRPRTDLTLAADRTTKERMLFRAQRPIQSNRGPAPTIYVIVRELLLVVEGGGPFDYGLAPLSVSPCPTPPPMWGSLEQGCGCERRLSWKSTGTLHPSFGIVAKISVSRESIVSLFGHHWEGHSSGLERWLENPAGMQRGTADLLPKGASWRARVSKARRLPASLSTYPVKVQYTPVAPQSASDQASKSRV